jgi:hypothetical protein
VPVAVKPEVEDILGSVHWMTSTDDNALDFRIIVNPPEVLEGIRLTDFQQQLATKLKWNTTNLKLQQQSGATGQEIRLQSHETPSSLFATLTIQGDEAEVTIFAIPKKGDASHSKPVGSGVVTIPAVDPLDDIQKTLGDLQKQIKSQKDELEELQFIVLKRLDKQTLEELKREFLAHKATPPSMDVDNEFPG